MNQSTNVALSLLPRFSSYELDDTAYYCLLCDGRHLNNAPDNSCGMIVGYGYAIKQNYLSQLQDRDVYISDADISFDQKYYGLGNSTGPFFLELVPYESCNISFIGYGMMRNFPEIVDDAFSFVSPNRLTFQLPTPPPSPELEPTQPELEPEPTPYQPEIETENVINNDDNKK